MRFALTARRLADDSRRLGLVVPAFRSPPRLVGSDRTIRRRDGHVTVAVRARDRPWPAVVADLIEGIVITNGLSIADAGRIRADLWEAMAHSDALAA